jgi:hypothetical protein
VDTSRILKNAERDEVKRTVLREAVYRFNNELLPDEERMLLLDRIRRLRKSSRCKQLHQLGRGLVSSGAPVFNNASGGKIHPLA